MKPIALLPLFFLLSSFNANAAGSALRIACDGDAAGAEVYINGKFKGECPLDLKVPEGKLKLRVQKTVDADHEPRMFEQEIRMGDGVMKKVEVQLGPLVLNAAGKKREEEIRAELEGERRACPECPEMVVILSGSFDMGSNGDEDEKPVHRVTIGKAFALGKTEVTQGQWKAVMGNNPSNCDNCPVAKVSWNDVQEFIRRLNAKTGKQYRLPSEAEWEYACRAGGQHEYCGSNDVGSVAWYGAFATPAGNSAKATNPVATRQANAFGLYDMSGNVWEWVEDSWHDNYNGAPADGSTWQGDGAKRVLRGGSWFSYPQNARAAFRFWNDPANRIVDFGFRLARTLP
jgi:formylglycine-generating enzyme required for sulfatase activity